MTLLRHGIRVAGGLVLLAFTPVSGDDSGTPPLTPSLEQKLKTMVVSVDFTNANIDQAIAALTTMSRQLDYDHKGINFVVEPGISEIAQPITLKLDNVPMEVAIHYVCELDRLRYKVDDRAISITAMSRVGGPGSDLVKRTFHVDPSFIQAAISSGVIPPPQAALLPPQAP